MDASDSFQGCQIDPKKRGLFVRRWERGARERESVCVSACVFDRKKETVPKGEKESV